MTSRVVNSSTATCKMTKQSNARTDKNEYNFLLSIFFRLIFLFLFFFYFSIFKWRNCVLQTKTNATVRVRLRFKTDYSGFLCRLPLVDSLFCRLFNCVLRLPSFKDKCETWTSFGWRIINLKLNENKNESRISKKNMCAQNEMIFFFSISSINCLLGWKVTAPCVCLFLVYFNFLLISNAKIHHRISNVRQIKSDYFWFDETSVTSSAQSNVKRKKKCIFLRLFPNRVTLIFIHRSNWNTLTRARLQTPLKVNRFPRDKGRESEKKWMTSLKFKFTKSQIAQSTATMTTTSPPKAYAINITTKEQTNECKTIDNFDIFVNFIFIIYNSFLFGLIFQWTNSSIESSCLFFSIN